MGIEAPHEEDEHLGQQEGEGHQADLGAQLASAVQVHGGHHHDVALALVGEEEGDRFVQALFVAYEARGEYTPGERGVQFVRCGCAQVEDGAAVVVVYADRLAGQAHRIIILDAGEQILVHRIHLEQELGGAGTSFPQAHGELVLAVVRTQGVHHQEGGAQDQRGEQQELQGQPVADAHGSAVRM